MRTKIIKVVYLCLCFFFSAFYLSAQNCPVVTDGFAQICTSGNCDTPDPGCSYQVTFCWMKQQANNASITYSLVGDEGEDLGSGIVFNIIEDGCTDVIINIADCDESIELIWEGYRNPNGTGSACDLGTATVPVEFGDFDLALNKDHVELNWETHSELNNEGFFLQKSTDGKDFKTFAFVNGKGITNDLTHYNFTDRTPEIGTNYYRLKQVDFNGKYEYSAIRAIDFGRENEVEIYYNQVDRIINIQSNNEVNEFIIYNLYGQRMMAQYNFNGERINVSQLNQGVYFLVVKNKIGKQSTFKFNKI